MWLGKGKNFEAINELSYLLKGTKVEINLYDTITYIYIYKWTVII